ncbi:unnamed protein product [marine sediment metagenome]|uniref:Uncharacterized protein n=1 Tax=marine sediment metagenome TaxID=412755 RepID=X1KMM5_9ZZZZ
MGVLILLTPFFIVRAFGSSWEEGFEEYPTGYLSDNPKWSDQPSIYYFVSDDEEDVFTGSKAGKIEVYNTNFPEIIFNPNQDKNTGVGHYTFVLKPRYWTSGFFGYLNFKFSDTENAWFSVGLTNNKDTTDTFDVDLSGYFFDCDTLEGIGYSDPKTIGQISKDDWIIFRLRGDFDDKIVEITTDETEGKYCMWFNSERTSSTLTKLELRGFKAKITFDYFIVPEVCELGTCKYCQSYETCMEAGCFWDYDPSYYALFGTSGFCIEPYTPEEEQCGSFYKCQFCMTQETCEAELNCEWLDRGFGEKCYMKTPEMPPEQVEWEVPDLEDCSELTGVEMWLCEIKNFVAGIFMPTQTALDKLHRTLGNFNQKFPFNYIGALNIFFADVKNSLDEEKEIPITILGEESNVSFVFWSEVATIGGVAESLKNIVIDFTSVIIFLAWFVWLISVIKRFF